MPHVETFTMTEPDDMHCHLRRDDVMRSVAHFTARQFARAVIMPNTIPPILTADDATRYFGEIIGSLSGGFEPLMTIQINELTTPAIIIKAKKTGVVAGKVYPIGVTTNSQNGVQDFKRIYGVLEAMQECGMLLLLHGESPKPEVFCMEREKKFHSTLISIAEKFPDLKIVLEHITTSDSVDIVKMFDNVAATITIHHLMITLDDVVGGMLSPHHFCKPIAKRPQDRMALREAAFSGSPKFFYGGDSAPHLKEKKECACGCAGVFNAPVALPLLVQLFEEFCRLDLLENFASTFGARFYGLPRNTKRIQLVKQDWTVPSEYSGIVPFMAGKTLHWKMAD